MEVKFYNKTPVRVLQKFIRYLVFNNLYTILAIGVGIPQAYFFLSLLEA